MDALLLLAGGVALYLGAEWLVGGASSLALSLRVPKLLVGLTVVAYGTSAPEVVVGVQAGLTGHGGVALGNVIGSNIANLGLILGIAALVKPARVDGALRRRELPVLAATAALVPLLLLDGAVSRLESVTLLLGALVYTGAMVRGARPADVAEAVASTRVEAEVAETEGAPPTEESSRARQVLVATAGLLVLVLGGHLFVRGATGLALSLGMSERLVGLTIVAIGTSLPELATSVLAALRGHSDIAVGNVVGSNVFNVLLCLSAAGLAGSVTAPLAGLVPELAVLGGLTLLAVVFLRTERVLQRWEGGVLLAAYVAFLVWLGVR
jgi:cation:H+ antiporter